SLNLLPMCPSLFCSPTRSPHRPPLFPTRRSSDLEPAQKPEPKAAPAAEGDAGRGAPSVDVETLNGVGRSSGTDAVTETYVTPLEIGRATSELQSRFDLVCRLLLEKQNRM